MEVMIAPTVEIRHERRISHAQRSGSSSTASTASTASSSAKDLREGCFCGGCVVLGRRGEHDRNTAAALK